MNLTKIFLFLFVRREEKRREEKGREWNNNGGSGERKVREKGRSDFCWEGQ
jgi:hypothetical protein